MTQEPSARRAVPGDESEIVRLRHRMRMALSVDEPETDEFGEESRARVLAWLKDPDTATTAAFVVDAPDGDGLAASVIGAIDERLPSGRNPSGRCGYVYGVCTDDKWRRRGYARIAMNALLEWYAERGLTIVNLNASRYGDTLYRELGFTEPHDPYLARRTDPATGEVIRPR